jgi:HK97 family phage major capsid protein
MLNFDALARKLADRKAAAAAVLEKQMKAAEGDGTDKNPARARTKEERDEVEAILAECRDIHGKLELAKADVSQRDEIERLMNQVGSGVTRSNLETSQNRAMKSLGQQLVDDPGFRDFIKRQGHRSSSAWISPMVELTDGGLRATTLDTTSGSGGPLIVSDYRPGIVPLLFKRLVVADLLASGTTDSNSVTYMKETTFTNAAAPTTEGAAKPESTLVFAQVTDNVQKIAHFLPVTEEMLEDVAQTRSYVDGRLRLGVQLTEEDQLLNGSGTPPAIRGLLNRSGLTAAQARGTDTNADAIFKQITTIATTVFIDPDGVVLNPVNWQTIMLAKDANGQYYGAGPFASAQQMTIWGLPAVRTPSIASGTALVGAYAQAAQVFRKGGIRVEASNSHQDFFIKNLVAIRAEERLALAVYRPAAFGTVTGLN